MTLEDLLAEIEEAGWTLSWAYQYAPDQWRASLINASETELKACAYAPTFREALENAWAAAIEALEASEVSFSIDDTKSTRALDALVARLAKPTEPLKRRSLA